MIFTFIMCSMDFPGSSAGKESACNTGDPGSVPGLGRSREEGIGYAFQYSWASLVAQMVKNPPSMWETWVWSWVGKIPWRRKQQPTPIFLPGESSWTKEPGGLQPVGLQRVGHDWATFTHSKTREINEAFACAQGCLSINLLLSNNDL